MEAFSLLKYWNNKSVASLPPTQNDIQPHPDDDDDNDNDNDNDYDDDDDDGPFFDLELALPDDSEDDTNHNQNDDNQHNNNDSISESESESESEKEFNFIVSPSSSSTKHRNSNRNRSRSRSLSLSSSDDLIIKGNLLLSNTNPDSQPNSKPHFSASFIKSATKLRVFMLGLNKPKPKPNSDKKQTNHKPPSRKLFTVKFKVQEVPIVSLFTRDNSSRTKPSQSEPSQTEKETLSSASDDKEKRLMRKYLKMVKPLYVKVSKRYADKILSSPDLSGKAATPHSPAAEKVSTEVDASQTEGTVNVKGQKQGNVVPLPAGLRKHLGKGRSAAAATATVPSPAVASSKRRDDSLLQQHDWIQGAILHCKKSFNASTECESSQLPRSVSDPLCDISPDQLSEKSTNDKCV